VKGGEPTAVHLPAYLAGLPNHGSPLLFPSCPRTHTQLHAHPKSIDIGVVWPTSLAGRERPGGNEFAFEEPEKDKRG